MKRIILILFYSSLVFINCNPNNGCEDCPNPNIQPKDTIRFSQEFLDYTFFKEGSWWIYQRTDTTAQLFDTVTVARATNKVFFTPEISAFHALEQIDAQYMHSYNGFFQPNVAKKDHWQIFSCTVKDTNLFAAHCTSYSLLAWGYYYTWPHKMGDNGNWKLIDTIPIDVMNKKLPVLHIGLSNSSSLLWLSIRLGIVKFKTYTNQVWELKEYYIKP
jgi:hypothetical protein